MIMDLGRWEVGRGGGGHNIEVEINILLHYKSPIISAHYYLPEAISPPPIDLIA